MNHTSVVAAEFLPDGRALQILLADVDGTVHVLQFDPHSEPLTPTLVMMTQAVLTHSRSKITLRAAHTAC